MSSEALIEAVVERLWQFEPLKQDNCDIQPEGHPPETTADFYISVDEGPVQCTDPKGKLDEKYYVNVWLSVAVGYLPGDSMRNAYLSNAYRLTHLERIVLPALHGREEVRALANAKLGISVAAMSGDVGAGSDGSLGNGFQWPIWYQGRGATISRGADWAGGDSDTQFLVRQLSFYGGWRIQDLSIMR